MSYSPVYISPVIVTGTEISDTNNATTTSSTDALLTSMTVTPVAGIYMAFFTSSITNSAAGSSASVSIYVAGTQKAATLMKSSVFDGGTLSATTARGSISITTLLTLDGTQAVEVRWSISSGTGTCGPRILNLLRIG